MQSKLNELAGDRVFGAAAPDSRWSLRVPGGVKVTRDRRPYGNEYIRLDVSGPRASALSLVIVEAKVADVTVFEVRRDVGPALRKARRGRRKDDHDNVGLVDGAYRSCTMYMTSNMIKCYGAL